MRKKKGSGLPRQELIERAAKRIKRIDAAIAAVNRDLEELDGPYLIATDLTGPARRDVRSLLLGQPISG